MIYGIDGCGTVDDIAAESDPTGFSDSIPFLQDIPAGTECEWSEGATYNLIAVIFYFGSGILLCFTPQPDPLCRQVSK